MKLVYVFLAEGFEEIEALTPVDYLRRAKIEVDLVAIGTNRSVRGSHNIMVTADKLLSEVDFKKADMLILPGGLPGTTNLLACTPLIEQVKQFVKAGKLVAAICAAPSILGELGLLKGKRAICFPGFEDKLNGAIIEKGARVVVDGSIITSRGMGCANDFSLALVTALLDEETANQLAASIQYQ